jgi:hypothetical protein
LTGFIVAGESIEKECDNDASDELQCMPHHECMHSVSWSSDVVFNERCLQLSAMDDEERRATQKRMREKLVKVGIRLCIRLCIYGPGLA